MDIKDFLPISIRNYFSDRNKIEPIADTIQLNNLDERTRIAISNLLADIYVETFSRIDRDEIQDKYLRKILTQLYNQKVKPNVQLHYQIEKISSILDATIERDSYNKVFDLLEFVVVDLHKLRSLVNGSNYENNYISRFNGLFEHEFVGYRFIGDKIIAISDKNEVDSINEASKTGRDIRDHLNKATLFLGDREHPDYANSIKESITALEVVAQIVTGVSGSEATLGKMLKKLEEQEIIEGAMKSAFSSLYGFASEGKGIRHGGKNGAEVSFAEAKYILVISTAFINFVMSKIAQK